jgi:lipopolysaccharide transport system ATP-binding protein
VTERPAIDLQAVSKRYTKYDDTPTLASGLMRAWSRSKRSDLWAVENVDLQVRPGEAVGVIGRNGSGKSTLLQMLCGVTSPTSGSLNIRGRIAPLISVGVGFHPELTGRENVFVNGSILGLKRSEIARRLDEIVAFSEIESFIDTPVKFYSSGMFVRLGFSVAAHVEPDVLLIDEVLAVGDLGFQIKCFEHMNRLLEGGTTIVLVSHNLAAIQRLCPRAIVMVGGHKTFDGLADDAVSAFHQSLNEVPSSALEHGEVPFEPGVVELLDLKVGHENGSTSAAFEAGDRLRVHMRVRAIEAVDAPFLFVAVQSELGLPVYREMNLFDPFEPMAAGEERLLSVTLTLRVGTGSYAVMTAMGRGTKGGVERNRLSDAPAFLVPSQRFLCHVSGRPHVMGVSDLEGAFTSQTQLS